MNPFENSLLIILFDILSRKPRSLRKHIRRDTLTKDEGFAGKIASKRIDMEF